MKSKKATNGVCTEREYQDLLYKLKQLESDKRDLAREIKDLNHQKEVYRERISQLEAEVADAEKQARIRGEATVVGYDIRLRFLEKHRQRMKGTYQRVGTRAR